MLARSFFRVSGLARPFSAYSNHRDTPYNNDDTPFEFTDEDYQEIEKVLAKYPSNYKKSGIIPLLYIAQKRCDNFVPLAAMNKIAKICEVPEMDVYEVASFYTMFNRTRVGKYHLQVCGTTPCMVCGSRDILKAIEEEAGIIDGQTSHDGMFTVTEVECLGACVNAPMIQVNNERVYEDLTPETMKQLMRKWKAGEDPKDGPQVNRNFCEGPQGRTSLNAMPANWPDRDFKAAKRAWESSKQAAAK